MKMVIADSFYKCFDFWHAFASIAKQRWDVCTTEFGYATFSCCNILVSCNKLPSRFGSAFTKANWDADGTSGASKKQSLPSCISRLICGKRLLPRFACMVNYSEKKSRANIMISTFLNDFNQEHNSSLKINSNLE